MKGNRNTQTKQSHILLTQTLDDDIVKALNEYNEVAEEKVSKARFIRDLIRVGLKNQHQIPATV